MDKKPLPSIPVPSPTQVELEKKLPSVQNKGFQDYLFRFIPALDSLRTYSWGSFRLDLFAGLTVAAVAVPQAMAYATIADLPPQYGLYTAIVMTAVGAVLDSSKQLINGPTNAISIALLSAIAFVPPEPEQKIAAAILMAFLIGILQTGITLLRLGDLTRFISHSVIVGFTLGASLLLVMDQMKNFFGITGIPNEGHFLFRFYEFLKSLDRTNFLALGIGLGTIFVVLGFRWISNRIKIPLPDLLLSVLVMALLVWFFEWDPKSPGRIEAGEVAIVGNIPTKLPHFQVPTINWEMVRSMAGSATAIGLLGLLEALAMAKSIAARTRQKLDLNQQCLSEGLANLTGSFFQCFPGSGSLTRSAINVQAGAVSQWSGVFAALAVAATVLLFGRYAYYIPRAALAGILLLSSWRLVDRKQLLYHLRTTRYDGRLVAATALSAIIVSVEFCMIIGVLLSFFMFVTRAARIHLTEFILTPERVIRERLPSDSRCNRILIFDLEGELFFGSANDLENHLETITDQIQADSRVIVMRLKRIRNPDAVCMEILGRFLDLMKERKIHVLFCGVRRDLRKVLISSGIEEQLGANHIFAEHATNLSSTLDAVRHAYDMLHGDHCSECPRKNEGKREVLYYMI